jgi:Ca-activated chloride channel family protein
VDCEVMPRDQAEEVYENARADGDAPALLEAGPDGLYTANIGNLKRGEEVVLEIRFAQLVAFEQGGLRLAVPMNITPRYGNPSLSGLQPHQVPEAPLHADYPLKLSVLVAGAGAAGLAGATLECPTHPTRCAAVEGGMRIELAPGARLDRDVVLLVTPENSQPHVLTWAREGTAGREVEESADLALSVALAAFEVPAAPILDGPQGLALKLLVDCSGSMGADGRADCVHGSADLRPEPGGGEDRSGFGSGIHRGGACGLGDVYQTRGQLDGAC